MERELSCRHCDTRNRVDLEDALRSPDRAVCGRCRGRLFLGAGEPYERLDPRAYEHPLDRQALEALRRVPGVNTFLRFLLKHGVDRTYRLLMKQNFVQVRDDRLPSLHALVREACETLDLGTLPETYVVQSPVANAWTTGVETYQLCLTTGLLEILDDHEVRAVVAHEVGHMQAGHVLYKTAALILYHVIGHLLGRTATIGGPLLVGMYLAFRKWERCAELTADRADLLATRDLGTSLSVKLKLASGSSRTFAELDVEQLLAQAREVEELVESNWIDQLIASWQQAGLTHPFTVWRAKHVDEFARSPEFWEIRQGRHRRRDPGPPPPPDEVPAEASDEAAGEDGGRERKGRIAGWIDELRKLIE
jgi:Zn-dependent protease with chaperone function